MAALRAGQAVTLRVRRDNREFEISLIPKRGCHRPGIAIAADAAAEIAGRALAHQVFRGTMDSGRNPPRGRMVEAVLPSIDFGLSLACGDCGWRRVGARSVFITRVPPVVTNVIPDGPSARAGVLVGDTLVAIQGVAIEHSGQAAFWEVLRPGVAVRFTLRRGDSRELTITPDAVRF